MVSFQLVEDSINTGGYVIPDSFTVLSTLSAITGAMSLVFRDNVGKVDSGCWRNNVETIFHTNLGHVKEDNLQFLLSTCTPLLISQNLPQHRVI